MSLVFICLKCICCCCCRWYWLCTMGDDFSQSLTPPVSPFGADRSCELFVARPPSFCCSETKNDPSGSLATEGYVTRGFLKRYTFQQYLTLAIMQHISQTGKSFWSFKFSFITRWFELIRSNEASLPKELQQNGLKFSLVSCSTILFLGCCYVWIQVLQNLRLTQWKSLASLG